MKRGRALLLRSGAQLRLPRSPVLSIAPQHQSAMQTATRTHVSHHHCHAASAQRCLARLLTRQLSYSRGLRQVILRTRVSAASGGSARGLDQAGRDAQGAADDLNKQLDSANRRAKDLEDPSMAGQDVKGDMVAPSPANKQPVRVLALAAALAIAARGSGYLPARAAAFAHLLSWAILVGTNLWTTFFAGITMFKNLPRQVFGKLQSKLFPQYFMLQTAGSAIALATLYYSGTGVPRPQLYALGVALVGSLANWLAVEPHTTGIMLERYELENAPQRDNDTISKMYKTFSKWHGISSMLNLVVLVAAVTHGWWIAASVLRVSI